MIVDGLPMDDNHEPDPIESSLLTNARVMMVDDEPILTEVVRAFLESAGYTDFIGLNDPRKAIDYIQSRHPDVLMLDLMMPDVDGFEILRKVKSMPETRMMPVLVMTSASDADTKLKVLEMGATDFLEKPVDSSELVLRLRNTLAFKAHRDRLTYFDGLTNLPNRRLFTQQLDSALRRARDPESPCALLHIELTGIRKINESVGRRVSDHVIQIVAKRIQSCVSSLAGKTGEPIRHVLGRPASDEFALSLQDLESTDQAADVANRITRVVARGIPYEGLEFHLEATVGIATAPMDATDSEGLIQAAHGALANARQQGRHKYGFFSPKLNKQAVRRLEMERDIRKAVNVDQFELYYQPKVNIATDRICGAEALIRWHHPVHGLLAPGHFIPMAEELGLIADIGAWVLRRACTDAVRWHKAGMTDCSIAVNISAPHFADGRLLKDVRATLRETGLAPHLLTIEVTESMAMADTEDDSHTLEGLKALGVRTSIDDFGTGFSSLSNLKRMRLDELKIDRSFISGVPADTDSSAIVLAVLAMSRSLGFEVTAEGVEEIEQLEFLRAANCDIYQGFLCSQPIPVDKFMALMQQQILPRDIALGERGNP